MNDCEPNRCRIFRWFASGSAVLLLVVGLGAPGLLYGWTHFARSLPALQGWHLQGPDSEFKADEVERERTAYGFDDYRRQEDQVFKELENLVSMPWAAEANNRFSRFQPSSLCNPATILDRKGSGP